MESALRSQPAGAPYSACVCAATATPSSMTCSTSHAVSTRRMTLSRVAHSITAPCVDHQHTYASIPMAAALAPTTTWHARCSEGMSPSHQPSRSDAMMPARHTMNHEAHHQTSSEANHQRRPSHWRDGIEQHALARSLSWALSLAPRTVSRSSRVARRGWPD